MNTAAIMLLALAIDAAVGWPRWLHARIGHPVVWIGHLIGALDTALNRAALAEGTRRRRGVVTLIVVVAITAGVATALTLPLGDGVAGAVLTAILAWPLIAARSLHDHVAAVARPLTRGDLAGARHAVAMIVGRDPAALDRAGVARAATESLAENTSDGIVAPIFWGVLLGLPGIAAYKAVNTLDSMIGHRTPRHAAFGRASARFDDLLNLAPARLAGALFAVVSRHPRRAARAMFRDARRHRSPNAGWPEAAMAGALGIRLSGPRIYPEGVADEPWLNSGAPDPAPDDLSRALALYRRALLMLALALAALAAL